jgi:DNA-directed RNA polymerase specialized sigma24 family protein
MKSFFLSPEQYSDLKGRYAKFNEPWTAEEAEELKQMTLDGVSRAEMSAQLGRSPNAIKMKLQSLGLYVPKPASRPWTPGDEAELVRLYREGVSFAELASVFSRTEGAILRRLILLRAAVLPDSAPTEASDEAPVVE